MGTGNTSCTTCPPGSYCTGGSNIETCPTGKTSNAGDKKSEDCYTTYVNEWVKGETGITEFERTSHKSWASDASIRLICEEYYNEYLNQSYIKFTGFKALSPFAKGMGVMYVGGEKDETKGIFIIDSAGNKELVQQMSHWAGDTKFNFQKSNANTWIDQNVDDTTKVPWKSKKYTHNSAGTLTLTLMVDVYIMNKPVVNIGRWIEVEKTITLTDLR